MSWSVSLQNAQTFFLTLRKMGLGMGCSWVVLVGGLERRLVVRSGATAGSRCRAPRVVVAAAGRGGPTAATAAATAAVAATPTTAGDLVHLRRGVAQRGADLVDLELDDGALLALPCLERPLTQPAGHHDPHAAGERLGDVLRRLSPHVAPHEQRLAVLPLAGLAVEGARGGGHGEVRDGRTRRGEAQFGVGRQVADHGDDGFASHDQLAAAGTGLRSRRRTLVRSTDSLSPSWRSSSETVAGSQVTSRSV